MAHLGYSIYLAVNYFTTYARLHITILPLQENIFTIKILRRHLAVIFRVPGLLFKSYKDSILGGLLFMIFAFL